MRQDIFIARRRAGWERLETLVVKAERRGVRALDGEEIDELGRWYRAATADLATAQTRGYEGTTLPYLNRLVARGHAAVYSGTAPAGGRRMAQLLLHDFPCEVRRSWGHIAACASIFTLAAIVSYAVVDARPLSAYALVPGAAVPFVQRSLHDSNFAVDSAFAPAMSAAIITNNIQVAALAFAGGMTLGIVTIWEILNNGLMMGALGALFANKGFGVDFLATVAPHGVIELTAIQIAGGAGLLLAAGVLAPGPLRRIDALKANARRAATLFVGVACLLAVAGTIEGFFSPLRTPPSMRLSVGGLSAVALALYFTSGLWPSRRGTRRATRP